MRGDCRNRAKDSDSIMFASCTVHYDNACLKLLLHSKRDW